MRLSVIAVGERMPAWVTQAVADYARRMPKHWPLQVVTVPAAKRGRASPSVMRAEEAQRLLAARPKSGITVALERTGQAWTSERLADNINMWEQRYSAASFLIGGPDGLDAVCHDSAEACWSLSQLTLPHALVRVVVAEQLYRAWTLVANHPYHR